jgi:hypothetical protein
MRGIPIERSTVDYAQEWRNYYENIKGDTAKLTLFAMLKERRDRKGDANAAKVLEELVARWLKEKS